MTSFRVCTLLVTSLFGALLASSALAQTSDTRTKVQELKDDGLVTNQAYQRFHPDERWLQYGMNALAEGRSESARAYLLRSARYASKPAQAMYAQLLWEGEGGPSDRALAYVWMDMAAERGYPSLVDARERYWQGLDAHERERALAMGPEVFDQYADAVAKQRLESVMRRGLNSKTGSRTGFNTQHVRVFNNFSGVGLVGGVSISLANGASGAAPTAGNSEILNFWDQRYWQPDQYWPLQAQRFERFARGTVAVGPLQPQTDPNPDSTND